MSLANSSFAHLHNHPFTFIVVHDNKTVLLLAFQFCYRVHDDKIVLS